MSSTGLGPPTFTNDDSIFRNLDLKGFFKSDEIPYEERARELALKIQTLKHDDISWKLQARKWYGLAFAFLLFAQNYFVLWLTYKAFHYDQLKDISAAISVVISGTLIETAFIIRIIVQWVFSDIDYEKNKKDSN